MKCVVLTDEQTLDTVLECLVEHLPIDMQGACDPETLFSIVVRAASTNDSIEHTCETLEDVPSGNAIRYHLESYQDMAVLEEAINQTFQARLPSGIRRRQHRVAMDLNLRPYYGTPTPEEVPYIYRSQATAGTCSFYAYASGDVITRGKRMTLALTAVQRQDTMVAIVTRILARITAVGLRIKRLYLDRGFFSVPVIRWLQALNVPFEMPVILRGKQGGTRQLVKQGKSYQTDYTMHSQDYGTVSFTVVVVGGYRKGKGGQHGQVFFVYAIHRVPFRGHALYQDYRRRFGIETSYRLKNVCCIKTTTKNPVVRLLFVGIAFLLIDLWVYLLWTHVSFPRQGGRLMVRDAFPLKTLLEFLRQAIDRHHPVRKEVVI
jgi:putative transposase